MYCRRWNYNQVKKLRDKIYQHFASTAHNAAENILKEKSSDKLEKLIVESSTVFDEKTNANFRTAYTIAKECMSFKKTEPIVSLQQQNGILMGSILIQTMHVQISQSTLEPK